MSKAFGAKMENLLNMQASTTLIRFGKGESTLNASGHQTRSPAELQSLCNVGFRRRKALPSLSFLNTIKPLSVLIYVDGMRREVSRAETLSMRQQELWKLNGYDEILSRARSTDLLDSW